MCVCGFFFFFFLPSQSGDTKYVLELLWYFVWKTQIEKHCIPFEAETWDLVIYVTGDLYDLHTLVMLLQSVSPPLLLLACCWQALLYCKHLSLFAAHLRGVIAYPLCMKREFLNQMWRSDRYTHRVVSTSAHELLSIRVKNAKIYIDIHLHGWQLKGLCKCRKLHFKHGGSYSLWSWTTKVTVKN